MVEKKFMEIVTPACFKAESGKPDVDSGPFLNAFFRYCAENFVPYADITGDWYTDETIVIGGAYNPDLNEWTTRYHASYCRITARPTFKQTGPNNPVVRIQNSQTISFTGHLDVVGGRNWQGWSERINSECIHVTGQSHFIRFDAVSCRYAKRDGFRADTSGGSGVISHFLCQECGTAPYSKGYESRAVSTIVNAVNTGSPGSHLQRTLLTVDSVPDVLNIEDFVLVDGSPHAVTGVDHAASTVEVFPWVNPSPKKAEWIIGSGFVEHGSDAGLWNVGQIASYRSATALKEAAQYPGNFGQCVAHGGNYAGVILPRDVNVVGGNIDHLYTEGDTPIPVLVRARTNDVTFSFNIGSAGGSSGEHLHKWVCLWPNLGTGQVNGKLGITVNRGGHRYGPTTIPGNLISVLDLQPVPSVVLTGRYNNAEVVLQPTPGAAELFGLNSMIIHAFGTGKNKAPEGKWTFVTKDGSTVNGNKGDVGAAFEGLDRPAMFVCILDVSQTPHNWIVYNVNDHPEAKNRRKLLQGLHEGLQRNQLGNLRVSRPPRQ